jgi:hypothetical protein
MAKTRKAKSAKSYAGRLLRDQYVHDQLRDAAGRLQQASARISRTRGKAAEDKKVYEHLRQASVSIRKATLAVRGRQPEPKRRGRKLLFVALAGGGAAVVLNERGRAKLQAAFSSVSGGTPTGQEPDAPQGAGQEPDAPQGAGQEPTAPQVAGQEPTAPGQEPNAPQGA